MCVWLVSNQVGPHAFRNVRVFVVHTVCVMCHSYQPSASVMMGSLGIAVSSLSHANGSPPRRLPHLPPLQTTNISLPKMARHPPTPPPMAHSNLVKPCLTTSPPSSVEMGLPHLILQQANASHQSVSVTLAGKSIPPLGGAPFAHSAMCATHEAPASRHSRRMHVQNVFVTRGMPGRIVRSQCLT